MLKNKLFRFILLLGLVSLFADITYEGARSIIGPYFALLGAGAKVVGITAGLAEFLGWSLRIISGYFSDKTKRYWLMVIAGYILNLVAVPLLALAGNWQMVVFFVLLERIGKAIRTPARDAILSYATAKVGYGLGFGLHEVLDQVGAVLGPLMVASVLFFKNNYRLSFLSLFIPAIFSLVTLLIARHFYPQPEELNKISESLNKEDLPKIFWLYLLAVAFVACGYLDFPLIAYHLKKIEVFPEIFIPLFYALSMGIDALSAFLLGWMFDKKGISIFIFAISISLFSAIFIFQKNLYLILLGILFWGFGMGAQESIMRAIIARIIPSQRRGLAYGLFNAGYGLFWFLGSMVMGILYDFSLSMLIIFSVVTQLISVVLLLMIKKYFKNILSSGGRL